MNLSCNLCKPSGFQIALGHLKAIHNQHTKRYFTEKGHHDLMHGFAEESMKERVNREGLEFREIVVESKIVGYFLLLKDQLLHLIILDSHRGNGYGRMAVQWILNQIKKNKTFHSLKTMATPNVYLAFQKMGFSTASDEIRNENLVFKWLSIDIK